ncbi:MAG: hypothetical protein GXP05_09730 [Alphaproteobacteria bacterium]|nr:hypothetical protein [Alphaproteobacteria bacterium]
MAKVVLLGGKWLGARVLEGLVAQGHEVSVIAASRADQTVVTARRLRCHLVVKPERTPLIGRDIPWRPDLVVSAHSFRIVPGWLVTFSKQGAIGYHPSVLPSFKGRHAVQDTIAAGVRMTGGTVYHLTDQIDGGAPLRIGDRLFVEHVQIIPGEDAAGLWQRVLAPVGLGLLLEAVGGVLVQGSRLEKLTTCASVLAERE